MGRRVAAQGGAGRRGRRTIGDVIAVTDATLALEAAAFRVTALRLEYAAAGARAPRYTMTLGLGEA